MKKDLSVLLIMSFFLMLTGSVFALANESFSLNFPVTNGTTTYVTYQEEQAMVIPNVVGVAPLVIFLFLLTGFIFRRKSN